MNLYKIFRHIYYYIPFKKEIYYLVRLFYTPSKKIALYLKFRGIIKVKIGSKKYKFYNNNTAIETLLFWRGIYSHECYSLKAWELLSKDKETILDIGCNTGVYSVVAREFASKSARIIGFEPIPRIANLFKFNMELNNINVEINQLAVSDRNGIVSFYDMEGFDNQIGSLDINHVKKHKHHTAIIEIKTKSVTIDSYVELYHLEKIDLIKIDVEGVEHLVIEGIKNTIIKDAPAIIVEISNQSTANAINNIFNSFKHNYLFYEIIDDKGLFHRTTIEKKNDLNYMLCTHSHIPFINNLIRD